MKNNGNITRLRRGGLTDNLHGSFGLVDNLCMTYAGNMLVSVCDSASHLPYANATDFGGVPGQEHPLTYNASGSLVSDAGRGIARIDYDRQNNPVRIQFTNGSVARYVYGAAGEKLRATHLTAVPNITVAIGSTRELSPSEILGAGSTDYLLGGSLTVRNGRIDKYLFDEGYAQAAEYSGNVSRTTSYLKSYNFSDAEKQWNKNSQDYEHYELTHNKQLKSSKKYHQTKNELIRENSALKQVFTNRLKEYE